ncbi:MAG: hypothetical protein QME49_09800, partial [bacterium]|nr:hypothetical protein [bacterium]
GLLDNDVNVIAVDSGAVSVRGASSARGAHSAVSDTLWCVTRKGIAMYDPLSGIWKRYTREDGVDGTDINPIGVTDNYILFESDKGVCCWYDKSVLSMKLGTLTLPENLKSLKNLKKSGGMAGGIILWR